MSYCSNCGKKVEAGVRYCPSCGMPMPGAATEHKSEQEKVEAQEVDNAQKVMNSTGNATSDYSADDIEKNTGIAILAYLGPLVLVPLIVAPNSKFARYHTNQGLVLLIAGILYSILQIILTTVCWMISWTLGSFVSSVFWIIWIAFTVLVILGIINAASGTVKSLPIVGKFQILKK